MDFPRRELSNGGLGIVVTLLVRRQNIFVCVSLIGNPAATILGIQTRHWISSPSKVL